MKRAHPFTLIELLSSLALAAILLTTLFYWYTRFYSQGEQGRDRKGPLIEERYANERLQKIIPQASLKEDQKTIRCFFTGKDNCLLLTFNRGVHIDPLLSYLVLGKLYYDSSSSTLKCTYWPLPKKGEHPLTQPSETLVLLDEVEKVEFSYYFPPQDTSCAVNPEEVSPFHPQPGWRSTWEEKYHILPLFMKISVIRKPTPHYSSREILFFFELPASGKNIIYK